MLGDKLVLHGQVSSTPAAEVLQPLPPSGMPLARIPAHTVEDGKPRSKNTKDAAQGARKQAPVFVLAGHDWLHAKCHPPRRSRPADPAVRNTDNPLPNQECARLGINSAASWKQLASLKTVTPLDLAACGSRTGTSVCRVASAKRQHRHDVDAAEAAQGASRPTACNVVAEAAQQRASTAPASFVATQETQLAMAKLCAEASAASLASTSATAHGTTVAGDASWYDKPLAASHTQQTASSTANTQQADGIVHQEQRQSQVSRSSGTFAARCSRGTSVLDCGGRRSRAASTLLHDRDAPTKAAAAEDLATKALQRQALDRVVLHMIDKA